MLYKFESWQKSINNGKITCEKIISKYSCGISRKIIAIKRAIIHFKARKNTL